MAFVEPAVDENQWSFPLSVTGYTLIQGWSAVQQIVVALGLFALLWSGAVSPSRLGRFGHYGAIAGMLGLAVTELVAIAAANDSVDTPLVGVLGALYGVFSILIGVALVIVGIAVLRAHVWQGWKRWIPLALGVWVFVPMLPTLALSVTIAEFAIAGWMLLFAALGWALMKHEDRAG